MGRKGRKGRRGGEACLAGGAGGAGKHARQEGQDGLEGKRDGLRGYTPGMRNSLVCLILLTAFVGVAGIVNGEVTRVDIAKRTDVGTSGYERIVGTIHFAVDPGHARNRVIVD